MIDKQKIRELAFQISKMTYAELREFAGLIEGDADKISEWAEETTKPIPPGA